MAERENPDFIKGLNLNKEEIATLERFVDLVEKAQKDRFQFFRGQEVAFTPGALLAVAVAKFVYDVYQDYGRVAVDITTFQKHFKEVIGELREIEEMTGESGSLDTYSKLRKDLGSIKKTLG